MLLSKFLDPKNDFAFKRIFGTEKNQDILIHFINDIVGFEGDRAIETVQFLKTFQDPEVASKKQSLVDVLCADQAGRQYIIEMQVAKTSGFEKRAQYYAAKAYGHQLNKGDDYALLKEVIFIAITDFEMFPKKANYFSTHVLLDQETYSHDLKDFSFTFIELPKFTKTLDQLGSLREKWAYFFKHAEETREEDMLQLAGGDEIIRKAYEELNRFHWTKMEMDTYEQEEKRERDARAILKQQRIEGKAEGLVEGRVEGMLMERQTMVRQLLKKGLSVEEVANLTDLSIVEIEQFKENHS